MHQDSLTIYEDLNLRKEMAIQFKNLARLSKSKKNIIKAKELYEKSYEIFQDLKLEEAKEIEIILRDLTKKV